MKFSFQGKENKRDIKFIEERFSVKIVLSEAFPGEEDNHKFKVGELVELVELEDYPEFNGEIVLITAIRENGRYGRAYYFSTVNVELAENLNWTYEYRLKEVAKCTDSS